MKTRKFLGVFLSLAMAMPSTAAVSTTGTIRGTVSMSGRALEGMALTLVNVDSGKTYAVKTGADGSFTAALPPGSYVFSTPGRGGVSISRAPLAVEVASGRVATASVELANLALQSTPAATGSATIKHDAANCITEGEFTLIEATFEPLASVVNGRLYFQSNLSPEWFYTEFEKIDPPVAGGFTHRAFIPKVNKDGGIETISYYLQVTSSDFAETKSPEHTVKVVSSSSECDGKLAPIGQPEGAVSVLSASGAAAGSLAGFGGIAGATIGLGLIAGVGLALIVGGVVVNQVTQDDTPTPTPTVAPTVAPTPVPTATPVAQCNVNVTVSPDIPADPSVGGRFCTATVTSGGTILGTVTNQRNFVVPCTARVDIFANAAPQSSTQGPLPSQYSGACSGSANGVPCILSPVTTDRGVGVTCSTR